MCQHQGEPEATKKTGISKAGDACGSGEGKVFERPEGHQRPRREGTEEGFREEVVPELSSRTSKG